MKAGMGDKSAVSDDQAVTQRVLDHMQNGANAHFTFGRHESAVVHFHRNLKGHLDR